jgi:amino acid transporter
MFRLEFALFGVVVLILMNMRGVKESVLPLVPIFLVFVATHLFLIVYGFIDHSQNLGTIAVDTARDFKATTAELGIFGTIFLMLRAYSLGAGTYTGMEAVSNGMPLLREPKVHTARLTMMYMMISLATVVMGLILAYLLYHVEEQPDKTLNAVLLERVVSSWKTPGLGIGFLMLTLISESAILFIAAQTGFLGGPRVLANMALDRWLPTRLAILSDRLVTQNGVVIMGVASLLMMMMTRASVGYLIVLYSINVFITFVLTQMGLVRHWFNEKSQGRPYKGKMAVAATGLVLCTFILVSVVGVKFAEGGWLTLLITGSLVIVHWLIRTHYKNTGQLLRRLDERVLSTLARSSDMKPGMAAATRPEPKYDPSHKTAVILVNGFNGLGLHTLFNVNRLFGGIFRNFVFIEVGVIDAGNFKGTAEIEHLRAHSASQAHQYVELVKRNGFFGDAHTSVTTDVVEEIATIAQEVLHKYPGAVFFGGQLVFPKELYFGRWLHNNIIFAVQRRFYFSGIPIVILPIRVY